MKQPYSGLGNRCSDDCLKYHLVHHLARDMGTEPYKFPITMKCKCLSITLTSGQSETSLQKEEVVKRWTPTISNERVLHIDRLADANIPWEEDK